MNRARKNVFKNQRRSFKSLSPQRRLEMEIEKKIDSMTKTCEKLEHQLRRGHVVIPSERRMDFTLTVPPPRPFIRAKLT